jgi:hypothetical protein
MGVVFEAFDREYGHGVALKTVGDYGGGSPDMLIDEFRARSVTHPNFIQMLDLFVEDDRVFFTMELLDATDLARWAWADNPINLLSTLGLDETEPEFRAGEPVPPRSRLGLSLDRTRTLASMCCDLVSALDTLHRAGLVHRDIKPSNILVTESGRPVLADFGLAIAFRAAPGEPAAARSVAGTPGYMAPELRYFGQPAPASDFYALGATLFHVLSGDPPGVHPESGRVPQLSNCADTRLATLVAELLDPDPQARPTAAEIFARLATIADQPERRLTNVVSSRSHSLHGAVADEPFVGRARELARLDSVLDECRGRDTATLVHVRGPSGVGKTGLITAWLDAAAAKMADLLVLRGHCHLHERLAFAGFDHAIGNLRDALFDEQLLRHRHWNALVELGALFPRLRFGDSRLGASETGLSKRERRHAAFAALRRLLAALADKHALVIWLDDVQWLDSDSESLLEHLLAEGGVPGALFIVSYRAKADEPEWRVAAGERLVREQIVLEPLSVEEVAELADIVGGTALHELTGGLPILVRMLGPRAEPGEVEAIDPIADPLQRAMRRMSERFDEPTRRLLSTIVLSPGPLPSKLAAEAAGAERFATRIRALEEASLIRYVEGAAQDARASDPVVVFHDRIRAALHVQLDDAQRRDLHARLARSYALAQPDAHEALAYHYRGANEPRAAAEHALAAAERAAASLAFSTAGDYYDMTLELLPLAERSSQLWAKLGDVRAAEGRAELAATAYERAARLLERTHPDHGRLLNLAAAELLHCGHVEQGYRILTELLSAHGLALPASLQQAQRRAILLSLKFIVETRKDVLAELVDEQSPDPTIHSQLDVLWTAATGFAHIDFALARVVLLEHLATALRSGARSHVLRGLTYEAAAEATVGGPVFGRRTNRLMAEAWTALERDQGLDRADTLPRRSASKTREYDLGWYWTSAAACSFFAGDWPRVVSCAETAARHYEAHGAGVTWERSVNDLYWLSALALIGDVEQLEHRHQLALADADARGDAMALSNCRSGYRIFRWLFRGQLDVARREVARCRDHRRWCSAEVLSQPWPRGGFRSPDYYNLLAATFIRLYADEDPFETYRCLRVAWPHLTRTPLLKLRFIGVDLRYHFARVALATAAVLRRASDSRPPTWPRAWTSRQLESEARSLHRQLGRSDEPCARAYVSALGAAFPAQPDVRRREQLSLAAERFDQLAMTKHAAAARWWLDRRSADEGEQARARMLVSMP